MTNQRISLPRISIVGALLFAWLAAANAQSGDPKSKPTGSISGRVTIAGKVAAGIHVAAIPGQTVNRREAGARAVTDAEGQYRIAGLPPGEYQVWTLTPGMIADPNNSPNYLPFWGTVKSIILSASEDVNDVDLKLIRGAAITGRVTNADNRPVVAERLSLQLLDANGNPRFGAIGPTNDEMYLTDDRGIYRIFGLPPGRYKVSVGYDPSDGIQRGRRYQKTFYPDVNDQSKAAIVELKEADEANNIDIKVQNAPTTYAASGRVIDAQTGVPIVKAGIRFTPAQNGSERPAPGFVMQADERGEFDFSGLSPGRYSAYASAEYYGGNFYGDPVSFEIIDKDVTGIELKTTLGLSVSGIVVVDGMSTKDLLALLPGLKVSARGLSNSSDQFTSGGNSSIAPDGTFQVDGLRPGRVSISVFTQGAGMVRPTIARIEHDGIGLNQGFDIQQSVSGLRVVISYGTAAIRGTVRFQDDTSIGDTQIYVSCKREGARDGTGAQVDARGHFLIRNLSPGTYELMVQVRGRIPSQPSRPIPPQKQTVTVANGAESEVTFVIDLRPRPGGP